MAEEPNGPDDEATRARQSQALRLRTAGVPWSQIAERLGYANPSSAHYAASAARKRETVEDSTSSGDDESGLALARLDRLLMGIWPAASAGHGDAIDRALKIMAARARVLAASDHTGSQAGEDPDIVATRERFAARRAAARFATAEDSGDTAS